MEATTVSDQSLSEGKDEEETPGKPGKNNVEKPQPGRGKTRVKVRKGKTEKDGEGKWMA